LDVRDHFGDQVSVEVLGDRVRFSSVGPDEAEGQREWYSLQISS